MGGVPSRGTSSVEGEMADERGTEETLSKHGGVSRDESPAARAKRRLAGLSKDSDPRRRSLECTSKSYLAVIAITTCRPACAQGSRCAI